MISSGRDAVGAITCGSRASAIGIEFPAVAPVLDRWRGRERMRGMRIQEVPPHVSLLVPWRLAPLTVDDIVAVAAGIAGIEPLTVSFRHLDRFNAGGVLFLHPKPVEPFQELTQRLVRAFPETPPWQGSPQSAIT